MSGVNRNTFAPNSSSFYCTCIFLSSKFSSITVYSEKASSSPILAFCTKSKGALSFDRKAGSASAV